MIFKMPNVETDLGLAIKHLEGILSLYKETLTGVEADDEYAQAQVARVEGFLRTLYERRSA